MTAEDGPKDREKARELPDFLALPLLDRASWLAQLCDLPTPSGRLFDVAFPPLRRGGTAKDWLRNQMLRHRGVRNARDRLRHAVVRVIKTKAAREGLRAPGQVLGMMLEVASEFDFHEVAENLRDWIRKDSLARESYTLGSKSIPLRQLMWELLDRWGQTERLADQLKRDLEERRPGCEQLGLVMLGQISGRKAIEFIPRTLLWKRAFWRGTMRTLLGLRTPSRWLAPEYREAWKVCFESILWDQSRYRALIGGVEGHKNQLTEALRERGIEISAINRREVELREVGGTAVLVVPMQEGFDRENQRLQRESTEAFTSQGAQQRLHIPVPSEAGAAPLS